MTEHALPRLMVLDDRDTARGVGWTVEKVFTESAAIVARQFDAYLARRLDPGEQLDPQVVPSEGSLGGVLGDSP